MISEFYNQVELITKELRETWNENMSHIVREESCGEALEILACLSLSIQDINDDILLFLNGETMPKRGYVYLMRYNTGFFKIGFSDTPPRRQNQLWGNPEVIHVIETDDMIRFENWVHARLDNRRIGQEIFDLTQQDIEAFIAIKNVFYEGQALRHLSLF